MVKFAGVVSGMIVKSRESCHREMHQTSTFEFVYIQIHVADSESAQPPFTFRS